MTQDAHKTIVVIEDDEDFLTLVNMMLAGDQFSIVGALNGREGLEAIRTHHPDLVILDLMLPDMNGWEVFMKVREDPASRELPVIILSVQGTRHDKTFGRHVAHVHDYLTKPCLPSQLRQSVASALGLNLDLAHGEGSA
jgi:DNA-binding response OmpR family regulator